jgi:hypothetical protein
MRASVLAPAGFTPGSRARSEQVMSRVPPLHMGGTMTIVNHAFGAIGTLNEGR